MYNLIMASDVKLLKKEGNEDMIVKAAQFTILVKDQQEAKQFYTERLGFVVCSDMEFGPGSRYVTVAPREENETLFELVKADTPAQIALIANRALIKSWSCLKQTILKETTKK